ncbi:hypothetical protein C8J57DRAFT_1073294, partial [Mycena rebaudengoi]
MRVAANKLRVKRRLSCGASHGTAFPPRPRDDKIAHRIISRFCSATAVDKFEEAGCAICGCLTLCSQLSKLEDLELHL